jgi:hypothetical protein
MVPEVRESEIPSSWMCCRIRGEGVDLTDLAVGLTAEGTTASIENDTLIINLRVGSRGQERKPSKVLIKILEKLQEEGAELTFT